MADRWEIVEALCVFVLMLLICGIVGWVIFALNFLAVTYGYWWLGVLFDVALIAIVGVIVAEVRGSRG